MQRDGWPVRLACAGGQLAARAEALDIPVYVLPLPQLRRSPRMFPNLLSGIGALLRLTRQIQPAVLIANTVRAAPYMTPAAALTSIPFIWYRHDFWLSETQPRFLWSDKLGKKLICTVATRIISNSRATAMQMPCSRKTVVIHNGIDIERFDPTLEDFPFRREYGIPAHALVIGTVGRLCAIKGQDRFLRILARVLHDIPDAWGVIVGGPIFGETTYQESLHRLACELGIASRMIFTGQLANPAPALAAMDVFVQPGNPEAFGLVNVEAMAMGKPVVGFAHGGLPEIIVENETGRLIPPYDEAAMAAAVIELLRDPARRSAMGQAGRACVETHFTIERVVAQVSHVLQEVLACPITS